MKAPLADKILAALGLSFFGWILFGISGLCAGPLTFLGNSIFKIVVRKRANQQKHRDEILTMFSHNRNNPCNCPYPPCIWNRHKDIARHWTHRGLVICFDKRPLLVPARNLGLFEAEVLVDELVDSLNINTITLNPVDLAMFLAKS